MLNLLIIAIHGSLGSAETVGAIQAAVLYVLTPIVVTLPCVRNFLVLLQAQRTLETAPGHAIPVQGLLSTPLLPCYQNDTFKQQKYGYKHLTRA